MAFEQSDIERIAKATAREVVGQISAQEHDRGWFQEAQLDEVLDYAEHDENEAYFSYLSLADRIEKEWPDKAKAKANAQIVRAIASQEDKHHHALWQMSNDYLELLKKPIRKVYTVA